MTVFLRWEKIVFVLSIWKGFSGVLFFEIFIFGKYRCKYASVGFQAVENIRRGAAVNYVPVERSFKRGGLLILLDNFLRRPKRINRRWDTGIHRAMQ
ncbi:hypothetical protein D9M71_654370 [compost metagenome]